MQRFASLCAVTAALLLALGTTTAAQTAPPAKPDDTPTIRVGAVIYADYTMTEKPKATDVDNNQVTANAFNIGRSYLNVTGTISHRIAFRVTPDIVRESGTGSSLNGSLTFRLKYAYGQFNLDDWMTRGSWIRLGMQQTPWVDFEEGIYRYRFQGTIFSEREGYLSSSDVGASFHYNFNANTGEVHAGVYNGENYNRAEVNDRKGFMARGTVRPFGARPGLRGLRLTGFYDADSYVRRGERRRGVLAATYEHPRVNAAIQYLATTDQPRAAATEVDGRGFSIWATPRAANGWEALLRLDHLRPDRALSATRNRTIAGVAYWFPHQGSVSAALLFDVEHVDNNNFAPVRPDERRWAVHSLISF
jgi:hypothetical protein